MDSDEFLDYWEAEGWDEPYIEEPTISIYSLPLLAVGGVSIFLVILLAIFTRSRGAIPAIAAAAQAAGGAEAAAAPPEVIPAAAAAAAGELAALFTPSVRFWENDILRWAAERGLDPNLAATVMQIESCGHPEVVSSAGATGLFQVMPFHFKAGEDPTQPETNAARGLAYLVRSLEAHQGDVYYALAGYNAGIGGSQRGEARWPAETQRYTYWGIGIYSDAQNGNSSSARLEEWLGRGGASLCRKAEARLGLAP